VASYYIDATLGDDAADGSIGTPWQTLDKIRLSVSPGDTVYLKKGETWTGEQIKITLVTPTQESERITIDAYGSGADPIVTTSFDNSVDITSISAYEADEAGRTTLTATGGGFTGSENKSVYFKADGIVGAVKTVLSDTQATVQGDFSTATQTQAGWLYSLPCLVLSNKSYITIQNIRFTDSLNCPLGTGTAVKFVGNTVDNMRAPGGYLVEAGMTDADSLIDSNTVQNSPACVAAIGGASCQNLTCSNNTIDDVDGDGIKFPTNTAVVISGNTVGNARNGEIGSQGHQDGIVVWPSTNCVVKNNTIFDHTQLVYVGLNASGGTVSGLRVYGNVGYITSGWTGGTAPFILLDGRNDAATMTDIDIFSNTCGDLGGDIAPIQIYGNAAGTYSDIVVRNNACWTDRTVTAAEVDTDANTQAAVDVDYDLVGGYAAYTTGGNGANTLSGQSDPFDGYGGKDGATFDFTISGGSALNNAGDPALTTAVAVPTTFTDIDGTTRTKDGGDIGAYETTSAVATGGPFDVAAGEIYVAGPKLSEVYVAGTRTQEVYTPRVVIGEVNS